MAQVRARLENRHRHARPNAPATLRRSAVLVPLFVRDGSLWVVFTRRTETVEHHRGQISFPGGAAEPGDRTLLETALRETEEELGISRADALPLGSLSPIVTITSFYIEPYVAAIPQPYIFRPAEAEIAEVLEVPMAALFNPAILEKKSLPGREGMVLFYHYRHHVIWGATARIVEELLEVLKERT